MPESGDSITTGLAPVACPGIHTLILGSLPSRLSVKRQQYYGNPQNAFWRIVEALVGIDSTASYDERVERLLNTGVGLWDVLHSSVRAGSLDAAIDLQSAVPNDIGHFLTRHDGIRRIGFNGRKAAQLFARFLMPALRDQLRGIALLDLPSTSPAHAAMPFDKKLAAWSELLARPDSAM